MKLTVKEVKYIEFDAQGELLGRYDSAIHTHISANAIEISEELFLRTIEERDGIWRWTEGKVTKHSLPEVTEPDQQFIENLCTKVDTAADRARTVLAGDPLKAMEYAQAHWLAGAMVVFSFLVLLALYSSRKTKAGWS